MAFLSSRNVRVSGTAAAVPREIERNETLSVFENDPQGLAAFVANVGVRERRVSRERNVCASDLCFAAAERLIEELR